MIRSLLEDAFGHHVWATLQLVDTCLALLAFIGSGPRRVPVGVVAAVVAISASALIIGIELT